MATVCVFCGARSGELDEYSASARELGKFLAGAKHTVVYGGGSTGIMGALADSILDAGGHITGVIPEHLATPELMHTGVADMRITSSMHERKALMHQLSDVYIALPGGFGTMEELFEAITWAQLDLHTRPIAVLNLCGIYDGLQKLIEQLLSAGFLSARCSSVVSIVSSVPALIEWIGIRLPDS